jgi:hypothetical protein
VSAGRTWSASLPVESSPGDLAHLDPQERRRRHAERFVDDGVGMIVNGERIVK